MNNSYKKICFKVQNSKAMHEENDTKEETLHLLRCPTVQTH